MFGYRHALEALHRGEIAVIAVHPPNVALVTYRMRPVDRQFLLSADRDYRAAALLTYLEEAHSELA
jgi:hypothetical protein